MYIIQIVRRLMVFFFSNEKRKLKYWWNRTGPSGGQWEPNPIVCCLRSASNSQTLLGRRSTVQFTLCSQKIHTDTDKNKHRHRQRQTQTQPNTLRHTKLISIGRGSHVQFTLCSCYRLWWPGNTDRQPHTKTDIDKQRDTETRKTHNYRQTSVNSTICSLLFWRWWPGYN